VDPVDWLGLLEALEQWERREVLVCRAQRGHLETLVYLEWRSAQLDLVENLV